MSSSSSVTNSQPRHGPCLPQVAGFIAAPLGAPQRAHRHSMADSSRFILHARRSPTNMQAALLLTQGLLRYRPVDDFYEEWLECIVELVSTAGDSIVLARSLPQ